MSNHENQEDRRRSSKGDIEARCALEAVEALKQYAKYMDTLTEQSMNLCRCAHALWSIREAEDPGDYMRRAMDAEGFINETSEAGDALLQWMITGKVEDLVAFATSDAMTGTAGTDLFGRLNTVLLGALKMLNAGGSARTEKLVCEECEHREGCPGAVAETVQERINNCKIVQDDLGASGASGDCEIIESGSGLFVQKRVVEELIRRAEARPDANEAEKGSGVPPEPRKPVDEADALRAAGEAHKALDGLLDDVSNGRQHGEDDGDDS